MAEDVRVVPATADTWADIETLMGQSGSVKGCWCMFFRQTPQERHRDWGDGNKDALRTLVEDGRQPGLVAYRDGIPAGWVSISPRGEFSRLGRSPVSKPIDDQPVWSLVCLYVKPGHRKLGIARAMVRAALEDAKSRGARLVEAYPVDDAGGRIPQESAYHGWVSLLASEGFTEVARFSPTRPVMRRPV